MKFDVETMLEYNRESVAFCGMIPDNYERIDLERKHPAVIILAGGAYWRRSDREKQSVALKFLSQGISPWILEYSVAPRVFPQALGEVLTAVGWLRNHAGEYHIDAENICVCGFSAGGHLAASTGCFWNRDFIQSSLKTPGRLVRPDKLILCYPVISAGRYAHQESICCLLGEEGAQKEELRALVSLENQVDEDFPPVFLWHTATDAAVPVQNALLFAMSLADKKIPLEMYVYPDGRHGLSTGDFTSCGELAYGRQYSCAEWVDKAVAFIWRR